jgi:methionyl-tRNA formyltransferase
MANGNKIMNKIKQYTDSPFTFNQSSVVRTIFFGSTSDSVIVLDKLSEYCRSANNINIEISAVVTQPPKPIGRKQIVTETPVSVWGKKNKIPILSFPANPDKSWIYENESQVTDTMKSYQPDLLVSACYGQKIPASCIQDARYGGINIHPSLLPRFRGADPLPWTILSGDRQTGVSIVQLSNEFDAGGIIGSDTIDLTGQELPDSLRTQLFKNGANLIIKVIPELIDGKIEIKSQIDNESRYARKLTRQDGFIPFELFRFAMLDSQSTVAKYHDLIILKRLMQINCIKPTLPLAIFLERMVRAFTPWPGVWTEIKIKSDKKQETGKRLKILSSHVTPATCLFVPDQVQLEGKNPVNFSQFNHVHNVLDNIPSETVL